MDLAAPHLLVALTAHGFGHGAMTAPVVNLLRRRLPGLRLTLQTDLPAEWLATRYEGPFEQIAGSHDFGFRMVSATEVRGEATAAAYRRIHARLGSLVAEEAGRLTRIGVDLVLSNIGYLPLLAARRAGIPSVALSCLNWADLYGHYFRHRPEGPAIEAEMLAAYDAAGLFLRAAPAMPMERLAGSRLIGPIARRGTAAPEALRRRLGLPAETRIGLLAFGGMDAALPFARWPRLPGWRWLVSGDPAGHPDLIALEAADLPFTDLLCSCEVVITKPGYGTFTEAAVNGKPVLYLPRGDWPESPALIAWLEAVGRCRPIERAELFDHDGLAAQLRKLFSSPPKPLVEPSGAAEGAEAILAVLAGVERMHK